MRRRTWPGGAIVTRGMFLGALLVTSAAEARRESSVAFRPGWSEPVHGTLILADGTARPVPLVVIVPEVADARRSTVLLDGITDRLVADGCAVARYTIPPARERVSAAIAAARTLRSRPGIDSRRVFLLGRGTAANEVVLASWHNPDLAGVALLNFYWRVAPFPGVDETDWTEAQKQALAGGQWQRKIVRKQLQQTRCPVLLMMRREGRPEGDEIPSEQAAALEESGNRAVTVSVIPDVDEYLATASGATDARALVGISRWVRATAPAPKPWWGF